MLTRQADDIPEHRGSDSRIVQTSFSPTGLHWLLNSQQPSWCVIIYRLSQHSLARSHRVKAVSSALFSGEVPYLVVNPVQLLVGAAVIALADGPVTLHLTEGIELPMYLVLYTDRSVLMHM